MNTCPEIQVLEDCQRQIGFDTSVSLYANLLGKDKVATEGFIMNTIGAIGDLIKRAIEAIKRFWFVNVRNDPNELVRNVALETQMRRAFAETNRLLNGIRSVDYDSDAFCETAKQINDVWVNTKPEIKSLLMKNADDKNYKKLQPDTEIKKMITELEKFGKACNTEQTATGNRQKAAQYLLNANAIAMECRRMTIMKYRDNYMTLGVTNVTAQYL